MNFLDKLNVILEVFDIAYSKDAMDDVYKTNTKNNKASGLYSVGVNLHNKGII